MTRYLLLFALLISSGFAQNASVKPSREASTSPDLCVPPAGSVAPSLPAKLLAGQGRVHFPITSLNPQAQEFFDQGVAQMHRRCGHHQWRRVVPRASEQVDVVGLYPRDPVGVQC